jgi:hypothetical protein
VLDRNDRTAKDRRPVFFYMTCRGECSRIDFATAFIFTRRKQYGKEADFPTST